MSSGRHRRQRPDPGPVTAAFKVMAYRPRHRWPDLALRLWPLLPALFLIGPALHNTLMSYADDVLGYDAVLALVACLAVTPFITVARVRIAKLRWWYGNWVFFLGAAGLALHIAYPPGGSPACGVAGNAIDWTGTLVIALLLPMTATSSAAAQKLLGPEWKRWQRGLVWVVWAAIGVHLAVMHAWLPLEAYAMATAPAVIIRRARVRKSIKAWRAGGYSTGDWWVILSVLGGLALIGVTILLEEEVHAIARAVAGA